ncbi:acyltransferase family protein [Amycolatopsis lurida]
MVSVSSERLQSLAGLRFVAACLVFVVHLQISPMLASVGFMAVSFFFVLSGFVMMWSMTAEGAEYDVRSFLRRRFWKIFPNYFAAWVLVLAILLLVPISAVPGVLPAGPPAVGPALANLLTLHSWVPFADYMHSVNPVSWSISSEAFFYLLFPVLAPVVLRLRARYLVSMMVVAVVVAWIVPLLSLAISPSIETGNGPVPSLVQYWFSYYLPLSRLPEFIIGMVLARLVRNGFKPRVGVVFPAALAFLSLVVSSVFLPLSFVFVAATLVPIVLVVIGAVSMDVRNVRSVWSSKPMVFLGNISYAFYLVHYPIFMLFDHFAGEGMSEGVGLIVKAAILAVLCIFFAWLLFVAVERPLMRRFGSKRKVADSSTPVTT